MSSEQQGVDRQTVKDLVAMVNELQDENEHLRNRIEKLEDELDVGAGRDYFR